MDATTTGQTNWAKSSASPKGIALQTQAAEKGRETQPTPTAATHASPQK